MGEDPLSGPGFGSFEAVQAGAVPAVSAFEGTDPTLASRSPFDGSTEGSASFQLLSGQAGFPFAGNDDAVHADVGEGVVDRSSLVTRARSSTTTTASSLITTCRSETLLTHHNWPPRSNG